ncbi:hypothetical protein OTU49_000851 [Cherax quadricarinatus]|uniref:PLAC domain-containing protein n=2 Tax=Cherax quadricarinatus TaxID=27406 RepID=A0AAW0XIZ7_CHEQU|nr:ADAMTS-like protein 4 [Cherax quadricarinatus]
MTSMYFLLVAVWACVGVGVAEECLPCLSSPCRKVTGLFTRPTLPVGYNLIARVPPQACNLTVTELRASSNYLAVRTDHGYIINGNWAVVPPGRYMGAGTGFFYSRPRTLTDGGEVIQAPGPLSKAIDIMIIYQSTNQGVRYEYWHPMGPPYPPPTLQGRGRGRGRGYPQRGQSTLQNVLPAYLASTQGEGGLAAGDYSTTLDNRLGLSPAIQGSVGYVIDNSVDGVGLPGAPDTATPTWKVWKFTPCSRTCGGGQQQTVYICTGLGGAVMQEEMCQAPKPPPQTVNCNPRPCPPTWQLGEWSQCSTTCGTGIMTRTWACVQEVTPTLVRAVPPATCPPPSRATMVPLTQPCILAPCSRWEVTAWTQCSVECGTGIKTRVVSCRAEGRRVGDDQCNVQEKPPKQELCHAHTCSHHTWFYTDWSEECVGGCENGVQRRRVWCSPGINSVEGECDQQERPPETRACPRADACAAAWFTGPWTPCSEGCGSGIQTREVVCVVFLRGTFRATLDIECNADTRPNATLTCNPDPCPPHWYYTDWSQCSRTCGRGSRTRSVQCLDHQQQPSTRCNIDEKPPTTRSCVEQPCNAPSDRGCVDRFKNCVLVQQARLCRYSYYRTVCCASCFQQQ